MYKHLNKTLLLSVEKKIYKQKKIIRNKNF